MVPAECVNILDSNLGKISNQLNAVLFLLFTFRYIRKWWARMPAEKRGHYKELFGGMKGIIAGVAGFFIFALVVNYVVHLQQNPLTGRSRFISLTPDQIQTIAQIEEEGVSLI